MKKTLPKKLVLSRITLRNLSQPQLDRVAAGKALLSVESGSDGYNVCCCDSEDVCSVSLAAWCPG